MKCLYCQRRTKVSHPLGGGTYRYCLKCFGCPGLTKWDPETYNKTSDKESFFRIDFVFNLEKKKFLVFFYPNTRIIQIYPVNEIKQPYLSFTIPNIIEPSNIKSITQRLLNLKAFL